MYKCYICGNKVLIREIKVVRKLEEIMNHYLSREEEKYYIDYFVHCSGTADMFYKNGGVVVCLDCFAKLIRSALKYFHPTYKEKREIDKCVEQLRKL